MHAWHRNTWGIVLGLCLTAPVASMAADAPSAQAINGSVLHADFEMGGLLLPDSHQTGVSWTTPERRINDYHIQFKSHLSRWLMGNHGTQHVADLFHLDQGMGYKLHYDNKTYWKCKMGGTRCPTLYDLLEKLSSPDQSDDHASYDPQGTEECPLHHVGGGVTVVPTQEHKSISGYATRLYKVTMTSVYADKDGNKDKNLLTMAFWNTPMTPTLRQFQALNLKLIKKYESEQHIPDNPLARFLPSSILHTLSAFSGGTSSKAWHWHSEATRKLADMPGFPVRIKLDWTVHANACPAAKSSETADADSSGGGLNPLGRLKHMIGHAVEKHVEKAVAARFTPDPDTPLIDYQRTITSLRMQPVNPDVFAIPAGFTEKPAPDMGFGSH